MSVCVVTLILLVALRQDHGDGVRHSSRRRLRLPTRSPPIPARYSVLYENDVALMIRVIVCRGRQVGHAQSPSRLRHVLQGRDTQDDVADGRGSHTPISSWRCFMRRCIRPPSRKCREGYRVRSVSSEEQEDVRSSADGTKPRLSGADQGDGSIDADPAHYFVQFENDVVRLARINVPEASRLRCTRISPTAS